MASPLAIHTSRLISFLIRRPKECREVRTVTQAPGTGWKRPAVLHTFPCAHHLHLPLVFCIRLFSVASNSKRNKKKERVQFVPLTPPPGRPHTFLGKRVQNYFSEGPRRPRVTTLSSSTKREGREQGDFNPTKELTNASALYANELCRFYRPFSSVSLVFDPEARDTAPTVSASSPQRDIF